MSVANTDAIAAIAALACNWGVTDGDSDDTVNVLGLG